MTGFPTRLTLLTVLTVCFTTLQPNLAAQVGHGDFPDYFKTAVSSGDPREVSAATYKWQLEPIKLFEAYVRLEGSAETIGLSRTALEDSLKLRCPKALGSIPLAGTPQADEVLRNLDPDDFLRAIGMLSIVVWTVGEEYPIAYHVELTVESLSNKDIYRAARLGCVSVSEIREVTQKTMNELLEEFAIVFLKARGKS